ncbi:uncharacterized protein N7477_006406 [Penicillium maclennaniae]|uniref:uncharacterized protein n=1 Tax=Penicillium maclennaniae TaxID=1343394 RepID=UPI0025414FB4|nr:uncharacterized protein N7477_006406 [Penicillium maclennaniae]KAJ5667836.1 hypothetical protein N7477_006406 [Penicillium maclennaniae]
MTVTVTHTYTRTDGPPTKKLYASHALPSYSRSSTDVEGDKNPPRSLVLTLFLSSLKRDAKMAGCIQSARK